MRQRTLCMTADSGIKMEGQEGYFCPAVSGWSLGFSSFKSLNPSFSSGSLAISSLEEIKQNGINR